MKDSARIKSLTWKLGLAVLAVRALYLFSSPFVMQGDGLHYYLDMLEPFRSNLLHATGYPFLFHWTSPLADFLHSGRPHTLRLVQLVVVLASVLFFFRSLAKIWPVWPAWIAAFLIGTDFLSTTEANLSMPDFLVQAWVMFTLSALIFAMGQETTRRKFAWYGFVGVLLGLGYLIKYNFVAAWLLLGLVAWDHGLSPAKKGAAVAASLATAGLVIVAYIFSFHQPTTGSYSLNLEHGWIHMLKLQRAEIYPAVEDGPATAQYLLATNLLPAEQDCCSPTFRSLEAVPKSIREPYQQSVAPILADDDHASLIRRYREVPKPEATYKRFQRIYYYLGLEAGDRLLRRVFWEGLKHNPRKYAAHVGQTFWEAVDFRSAYHPRVPLPESPSPLFPSLAKTSDCQTIALQDSRREGDVVSVPKLTCGRYYGNRWVWLPGVLFASFFAWPQLLPWPLFWGLIAAAAASLAGKRFRSRPLAQGEGVFLTSLAVLFAFFSFSALLFRFREKDLVGCQPLLCLVLVWSVHHLGSLLWAKFMTARTKPQEKPGLPT